MASSTSTAAAVPPSLQLLYAEEFAYVWKSLQRLGVAEPDLEDLTHDVFVQTHRALPGFDPSRPLRPWLFGIAFRVASEFRRRAQNKLEEAAPEVDRVARDASPESVASAREDRALVHAALEVLPPERRAVFVMHEIDGHPIPAVAEALQAPLNTCYSRLRLARTEFAAAVRRLRPAGGVS